MDIDLFAAVDRRCRRARPQVRDLRDRAILFDRMGLSQAVCRDADAILGLTHQDTHILLWVMEQHPDPDVRRDAARTLISSDRATTDERDAAITQLVGSGENIVIAAARRGQLIGGWVAWAGPDTPTLTWVTSAGQRGEEVIPTHLALQNSRKVSRHQFEISVPRSDAVKIVAGAGERASQSVSVSPDLVSAGGPTQLVSASLTVVLPVYGDPASLKLSFGALRPQLTSDIALIVVDDASPNPSVSSLAERFCREVGGHYHRLPINAGFALAVNTGLGQCAAGDVLLLNSDVILPPLALQRLRAAALSADDIATVSPFSSDAGSVTFPDPTRVGDAPEMGEFLAIDHVACTANAGVVVDVLAAHGSCLYVTQRMREVVGALALSYGRGYYEDIDLLLRAREHGLRNVAACDVFVTHLGSRSFGPAKHGLIARNHAVLCRRFPDFERDEIAFGLMDPLRAPRAAIERQAPVQIRASVLLIAPAFSAEALIRRRQSDWKHRGRDCCVARLRGIGQLAQLEVKVPSGPGPRSLRFGLDRDGAFDLVNYLSFWPEVETEILRPDDLLKSLVEVLGEAGHAVALLVDSRSSANVASSWLNDVKSGPAEVRRLTSLTREPLAAPGPSIRVLDRVAERAVGAHNPQKSEAEFRPGALEADRQAIRPSKPVLGVIYPSPGPVEEGFILGLARWMRRRSAIQILVLGFAIDETQLASPGNVWVSGLQAEEDSADVLSQYGVCAVLSPYRTSHVWYLDDIASRLDVPGAFFDWSPGGATMPCDRLALDADLTASDAYTLIEPWIVRAAQALSQGMP